MPKRFNADEVFDMAVQIERNGGAFYRRSAERCKDANARRLLERLATTEEEHERTFEELRRGVWRRHRDWVVRVFDPDGESQAVAYLRAIAEQQGLELHTDPGAALSRRAGPGDVLRVALRLEKDAIAFYAGFREAVPPDAGRTQVERIRLEEMGHVTMIVAEMRALEERAGAG